MKIIIGGVLVAGSLIYAMYTMSEGRPALEWDFWLCLIIMLIGMVLIG